MKKGYFQNQYNLFLKSFKKIDIKILFIIFFDLVFYFSMFLLFMGADHIIQTSTEGYDIEQFSDLLTLDEKERNDLLSGLFNFLLKVILTMVSFVVLAILSWSIFKGIVWSKSMGIKFEKKLISKFFILNLSWFLLFILIALLFGIIIVTEDLSYFVLTLFLLFIHFTNLINYFFLKNKKIRSAFVAIKTGFVKLHHMIVPYIVIILMFAITLIPIQLITVILPETYGVGTSSSFLILLTYAAWARFYIIEVLDNF